MAKRDQGGDIDVPGGPGIPPSTTRRDPANPTRLGGDPTAPQPFVHPNVSDPRALKYAQAAEQRRRPAPIPRYTDAVAGGPDVPIPRLDSDAVGGMPMAVQAQAERQRMPQPSFAAPSPSAEPALRQSSMPTPSGIVTGAEHLAPPPQPGRMGGLVMPGELTPADLLPPAAQQDPMYRSGHGADVAMNQPELAFKYGVMRGGQYIAPQQLQKQRMAPTARQVGGAKPATQQAQQAQLSPQTVEALNALSKHNSAQSSDDIDRAIDAEAQRGPARAAGATKPALSEDDKKSLLDDMDEFDITRLRNALYKDLLNNEEQKKIIESRLSPLNLGDLIMTGRVSQIVPIRSGVFEPEFQSYGGDEDLAIKRLLAIELENLKPLNAGFERYVTDKYTVMGLTVALKGMNKYQFPDVYNADGLWDEELFWKKYAMISKFNYHMIGSLVVNWFWFDLRVRHLFKAEALGNG